LKIVPAQIDNALEILQLQKWAYQSQAALYDDYSLPPLVQTLEEIQAQFRDHVFLKAVEDGVVIGSVRATVKDGVCQIGRLIVHPDRQNQGIGTALMHAIEVRFPDAACFELFTGIKSQKSLHLYDKLGYHPFRQEHQTEKVELIFLKKDNPTSSE
jgi:GNAT superfamily N-acetyltransferase